MARKTRKQSTRKRHVEGIKSIPELRQSFDYIDEFIKQRIQTGLTKDQLVKELRTEWMRVFGKHIQKKNATAFVEHMMHQMKGHRKLHSRMTRKQGGAAPLSGAPFMDPTLQQGVYLSAGKPPTADGHFSTALGDNSVYGSLTKYISSGFTQPEIGTKIPHDTPMPSASMGQNRALVGGGRALRANGSRKKRGGFILDSLRSSITQAFSRPIPSDAPPSMFQTAQSSWYGRPVGISPNPIQHPPNYALKDTMFPKMVNVKIDV